MDKKALCLEDFSLEKVDDNGSPIDGEYSAVEEGSIWNIEEDSYRFLGGEIRLVNKDGVWLEISRETFNNYFMILDLSIESEEVK